MQHSLKTLSLASLNKLTLSTSAKFYFSTTTKKVASTEHVRLPPGYNPVTPFALFVKEKTQNSSGEKSSDLIKKIASTWKELGEVEKGQYIEKSKIITEQKKSEFEKFPKEKQAKLLEENALRIKKNKHNKSKRELNKFYEETNRPKRPMGSFLLFCREQLEKDGKPKGKEDIMEFGKKYGEMWGKLSADEKKIYVDKFEKLKSNYESELKVWGTVNVDKIAKFNEKRWK